MKIFLAATETFWQNFRIIPSVTSLFNGDKYNLFYSYLHDKQSSRSSVNYPDSFNICDSGAHSFFTSSEVNLGIPTQHSQKSTRMDDPDKYVSDYIKWMQRNWDRFDFFVELDIQDLVGYEKVLNWRRLYKKAGVWQKVITCYHESNSFEEFQQMVDDSESRYVGIEGVRKGRPKLDYNRFIKYCYDNRCAIHGFAMVKRDYLSLHPFFSVDSSSMTYMYRAGMSYRWDKDKGKLKGVRGHRKLFTEKSKRYYHDNIAEPGEFVAVDKGSLVKYEDVWIRRAAEARDAIKKQEEYFTRLWNSRGVVWDEGIIKRRNNASEARKRVAGATSKKAG